MNLAEESSESRVSRISNSNTVQKFVLTGGPCGGKTTALERIRVFLSQYGVRVYTVPEAATILWTGGISPTDMKNGDDWVDFQAALMRTQFHLEDTLYAMAEKTGQKAVLPRIVPKWHPGWAQLPAHDIIELEHGELVEVPSC